MTEQPDAYLGATDYIDLHASSVVAKTADVTRGKSTPRDKALAIFGFVRDGVSFGFARGFWDQKASQVLAHGRGYCNTKSTLFVAMLRASGVPARQVFVDISCEVLRGIINPGSPHVDHSFVEVWLDGAWRATDSYIVDAALFAPAHRRANAEQRLMGYGVHSTGSHAWDADRDSFAQYNRLDPRPLGTRVWGVYADIGDFYTRAEEPWNRLNPLVRAGFSLAAQDANRKADALRAEG